MKATTTFILAAALLTTIAISNPVFAQSNQASYTVNLAYSTLQVTYPSQVLPGDSVTVNVQVTPKSNVYLQTLTATIYYIDDAGLHQVTSLTLVDNSKSMNSYNYGYGYSYTTSSFSKSFQVTVPQNAPRTSLEAVFSETAQSNNYNNYYGDYYSYFGYPYYYYGHPYYNSSRYSCSYYYCEYSFVYPAYYYPYYAYNPSTASTDKAIAPLSYVQANTPEYAALQSQYQTLQQQLQQSQAQNQQLQSTASQQSTTINQLNQQLASANGSTQTYQALAIGLGILAAALAVIAAFRGRSKPQPQTATAKNTEEKEKH
jgi:hypothetical protein